MPGRSVTKASTSSTDGTGSSTLATSAPCTEPIVVSATPSSPKAPAKACRDCSTASRSAAFFKPTEPSATVENPCTRPGSSASSGTWRAAGVVLTTAKRLRTARAEYLLDLPLDLLEVHELAIDGCESDVRHLVEIAKPFHHH